MLWQATWKAWTAVRVDTTKIPPQSHGEFMRQPLFLNQNIKCMDGFPIGSERNSLFRTWSTNGINRIGDIWDEGRRWYRDLQELHRITRSRGVVQMRAKIATTIPWEILPLYQPKKRDWVYTEWPNENGEQFHYLINKRGSSRIGKPFTQKDDNSGQLIEGVIDIIELRGLLQEARVLAKEDSGTILKINPQEISIYNNFSIFGDGKVRNLHFDPREWIWLPQGMMEETHFFD